MVQLYISDPVASVTRSVRDLKGFQKVMLGAGESKEISFKDLTRAIEILQQQFEIRLGARRIYYPGGWQFKGYQVGQNKLE